MLLFNCSTVGCPRRPLCNDPHIRCIILSLLQQIHQLRYTTAATRPLRRPPQCLLTAVVRDRTESIESVVPCCLHIHTFIAQMENDWTFIGPCIVIYSYSTTNKMHLFSQIIYSCKTLYMFRTVFPSIIRSSKLRIQQRYMSKSCCYLLLYS